ncbi:hypothetical protein DFA_06812 [Cavenderia fasciculata]|uniref:Uncharacterized protein n=1 Tax=Cavenderia fasciculata TaxID=261658 RepID=F4Q2C5_CACFS|nr:uncharacterized protein DFA_06812 [Cavenderia fasciculata]EGG18145.1 hypothetical protein DFA_06812 [Cavenderia fasciculata]|eukprot:XP_004366186.1 hypothetical protein DFA_06812 [Cavenderia fasciculata]
MKLIISTILILLLVDVNTFVFAQPKVPTGIPFPNRVTVTQGGGIAGVNKTVDLVFLVGVATPSNKKVDKKLLQDFDTYLEKDSQFRSLPDVSSFKPSHPVADSFKYRAEFKYKNSDKVKRIYWDQFATGKPHICNSCEELATNYGAPVPKSSSTTTGSHNQPTSNK